MGNLKDGGVGCATLNFVPSTGWIRFCCLAVRLNIFDIQARYRFNIDNYYSEYH